MAAAAVAPSYAAPVTEFTVTFAPSQTSDHQPFTWTRTPADGWFSVGSIASGSGVSFFYHENNFASLVLFTSLEFIAPNGAPLLPGVYHNASNFAFGHPGQPDFEFSFGSSEQDSAIEEFTILGLTYGAGGSIQSFGGTFKIFDFVTGAVDISGEAYYNFDPSVATPEPTSGGLMLGGVAAMLCFGGTSRWFFPFGD
jgi:hypothetical protein